MDRPILFSGLMVRALLEGRKTQTRRVLTPGGGGVWVGYGYPRCLDDTPVKHRPGDRLWVREAWRVDARFDGKSPAEIETKHPGLQYLATSDADDFGVEGKGRPSIFMPRWASRLTLIVTDVRVQRLQDISDADAQAEGIGAFEFAFACDRRRDPVTHKSPSNVRFADAFADLWDSLNAKRGFGWDANPWVCALTFTVHHQNIDQLQETR